MKYKDWMVCNGLFTQFQKVPLHWFNMDVHKLTAQKLTSQFLEKFRVLCISFLSVYTRQVLCFPLEGQWRESFTSDLLSFGLKWTWSTLGNATAVTFSPCDWNQIVEENLPEFLVCHLSTTWLVDKKRIEASHVCEVEKQFLNPLPSSPGCSLTAHHSVSLVHKPLIGTVVFYYSRCESMASFISGIAFNWGRVHVCEDVHIASVFPANSP